MNIGDTPEERQEFWGTTPASLMCCVGFLIGVTGAFLSVSHTAFAGISLLGIILLTLGIRSDLRKGFAVRWRKANFVFHLVFLVLALLCIAAALIVRAVEWKRQEKIQHPTVPYSEAAARPPQG